MNDDLSGPYHMTRMDEYLLVRDALPAVDLSIACSPVLSRYEDIVTEVQRTHGRRYILLFDRRHPATHAQSVSEDEVRTLRARFLVRRGYYALYFDCQPWAYYERDAVLAAYFDGGLYWHSEPLLKRSRIAWRQHLEDVRNTPMPDEKTVEGAIERHIRALVANSGVRQ